MNIHVSSAVLLLRTALMLLSVAGVLHAQEESAPPVKRVEIDKTLQVLRAYEGDRLVLESRVSTGRGNSTPNGNYRVQTSSDALLPPP